MEKLGFGALLKTAFKRCFERRLSHLVAIQLLLSFLALLPFTIGGIEVFLIYVRQNPAELPRAIKICIALALYYLPCVYFLSLVDYGMMREILRPEPRIGRGLKSGFARWKVAFYPIPWIIIALLILLVASLLINTWLLPLIGSRADVALTVAVNKTAVFPVNCAIAIVELFLICAVAANHTRVGFDQLYRRTFAAIRNGWGRCLGGLLMVNLLGIALVLPLMATAVLMLYEIVPEKVGLIVLAVLLCPVIWAALRLQVFKNVYFMNLFVDASGISRAEMGLPDETGTPAAAAGEGAEQK